jgi:long-chain acyl-CoA synthetase
MGRMDAHGFLTLMDRTKDVIISGGSNVCPRDFENVPLLYETVSEASVVGHPNAEWSGDVIAFVVPVAGHHFSIEALNAHCLGHIARFKWPNAYHVLASRPKNNCGTVLKTALRALVQHR